MTKTDGNHYRNLKRYDKEFSVTMSTGVIKTENNGI